MKQRIAELDWDALGRDLLERGFARTPPVLMGEECDALIALYADDARFRKRVDMERHTFGRGDYAYFANPLPRLVQTLRTELYRRLAPVANTYAETLGWPGRYPPGLREFLARCHDAGQKRPTPLVLHYTEGGYNRLHQDFYGEVFFPLQATAFLSQPGRDYAGGELLLLEQRPRTQARCEVLRPERGELVLFASGERPGPGKRGPVRVTQRHGVATVTSGERWALGLIFHDAK